MPKPALHHAQEIADREGIPLEEALQRQVAEEHRLRLCIQRRQGIFNLTGYTGTVVRDDESLVRGTSGEWFDTAPQLVEQLLAAGRISRLVPDLFEGTVEISISLHPDATEEKGEEQ